MWDIYHVQSQWHQNPVTYRSHSRLQWICYEMHRAPTAVAEPIAGVCSGSVLLCFVATSAAPSQGLPSPRWAGTADGTWYPTESTWDYRSAIVDDKFTFVTHATAQKRCPGSERHQSELRRDKQKSLVWVCIRCSVYITAFKSEVNLRKLGRDNQEQNSPLVEVLCNIYGI